MNIGKDVFVDSEMARVVEQRRLDELAIVAEFDHRFAATLPRRETNSNRPEGGVRRQQAPEQTSEVLNGNLVQSLFALAVETCAANRVHVAKAIQCARALMNYRR